MGYRVYNNHGSVLKSYRDAVDIKTNEKGELILKDKDGRVLGLHATNTWRNTEYFEDDAETPVPTSGPRVRWL